MKYVYDCGSLAAFKAERDVAIAQFHAASDRTSIDLLFLSHVHEDHVSGVEVLCAPGAGCVVDTIVLPLLNAVDRVISFARALEESPGEDHSFLRDLVLDPVVALARFNPRQIILVRRGEGGSPPPGEPGFGTPDRGPQGPHVYEGKKELLSWRLIGRGRCEQGHDARSEHGGQTVKVFIIDDSFAFEVGASSASPSWILAPYVDVEVSQKRADFIAKAADNLGLSSSEFEAQLSDPEWLLLLVTQCKTELANAYASIADLNVTSLCLYSGPLQSEDGGGWSARVGPCAWTGEPSAKVGWMGTGDADLKKLARRSAFLAHFELHLPKVRTLLLPHHGSEGNFDPELLVKMTPSVSIAAAERWKKWRHPGSAVVQAVSSHGSMPWVVTRVATSEVVETVLWPALPVGAPTLSKRRRVRKTEPVG